MEVLKIILTFAPPEPAKPLNDAQMCGSFYFYIMNNRIPFSKPYTNAHDLVQLLQSRGLSVNDTAKAEGYIDYIGYYRLSANRMSMDWILLPTDPLRIYFDLCIIKYFLNIISPNNDMKAKIDTLLAEYPAIDIAAMGFPSQGWENEPISQTIKGSHLPM